MAHALAEMLTVPEFELTTFANTEGYDELVLVHDIPVRSLCEHHVLPFTGVAHVGYLPGERILGLSKLARVVEDFSCRAQAAGAADHAGRPASRRQTLAPRGVGVVISAEHTCMTLRGARARGSHTTTSALLGHLREDPAARAEFLRAHAVDEGGQMSQRIVVVGAGLAAANAVTELRSRRLRRPDRGLTATSTTSPTSGRRCPRAT